VVSKGKIDFEEGGPIATAQALVSHDSMIKKIFRDQEEMR